MEIARDRFEKIEKEKQSHGRRLLNELSMSKKLSNEQREVGGKNADHNYWITRTQ